ncbi:fungal-specific transcription factor domain-containing protein [Cladorrhinum sp. PSN259]|nr:fungal-specific transcription factor domain-containing protein [Cladorrhinum sp. PSN259]
MVVMASLVETMGSQTQILYLSFSPNIATTTMNSSGQSPPAGYFSTFSILDPNRPNPEGFGKPQKRNRRVYVCIPCHRRKLKCDKGQPCSRCIQADAADECVYQKFPFGKKDSSTEPGETSRPQSSVGNPSPCVSPTPSENEVKPPRLHGVTHWTTIASESREAWPYITGSHPQWEPRYQHIQSLRYLVASLPSPNFPFGSTCECTQSRVQVLNGLPGRQVVDALVRSYFDTFEPIYRMFHPQQFNQELEIFWLDSNQCSEEWLSQFFMVIALGCHSAPIQILSGTGHRPDDWCDRFLSNAQFFFSRSSTSSNPTITTVRTLCLVIIAQLLEATKGTEPSRLSMLMGYLIQLGVSLHLHRTTSLVPDLNPLEAEIRRRLWVTVQFLDLDVAIRTGTSPIQPDSDIEPPLNISNTDVYLTEHGWLIEFDQPPFTASDTRPITNSTFQLKLASILPPLNKIIKIVNSPAKPPPKYETSQAWTELLLRKLSSFENIFPIHSPQLDTLKTIIYRALLSLPHLKTSQTKTFALSLLDIQSRLRLLGTPSPQNFLLHHGGGGPPATNCLLSLRRDDFGAAILYLCCSSSFASSSSSSSQSQEVLSRVRESLQDFRDWACGSTTHFDEFVMLSVAVGCLEGLIENGKGGIQGVLNNEVAARIEHTVLSGRLWRGGGGGTGRGSGAVTPAAAGGGSAGAGLWEGGFLLGGGGFGFDARL